MLWSSLNGQNPLPIPYKNVQFHPADDNDEKTKDDVMTSMSFAVFL